MTIASYNSSQIAYAHSILAGVPSDKIGSASDLEQYAKKIISSVFQNNDIETYIGQWELVWGPAVYEISGSSVADNALYIAQNKTIPNQLVIAISGTNPISRYGWIHEDFLINPMQLWPYTTDIQVQISNGTKLGLDAILSLTDGNGINLLSYLTQRTSAAALAITVTGHSLGGALSPALALALHDLQNNTNSWDAKGTSSIAVVPSAGPAAGNQAWAEYYDSRLGNTTTRLWNSIDIVPHAWEVSLLEKIPTLYNANIAASSLIQGATDIAIINSVRAGVMLHECCDAEPLWGKFNSNLILNARNIVTVLETIIANDLIQKFGSEQGWSASEIAVLEDIVTALIKALNKNDLIVPLVVGEINKLFELERINHASVHDSTLTQFYDFLEFIIQAGYQHTSAYSDLIGTQNFSNIVDVIIKEFNQP